MTKQALKKSKFPNISRFISDKKKEFWKAVHFSGIRNVFELSVILAASVISGVLFVAIIDTVIHIRENNEKKEQVVLEQQKVLKEILYWQSIAEKHKGYRDAYFRLAVLEYQIGGKEKAKQYLRKTLELDPNFDHARELEKILK